MRLRPFVLALPLWAFVLAPVPAQTPIPPAITVDFERFPGPDGLVGTADDIVPGWWEVLAGQFSPLGISFTRGSLARDPFFPSTLPDNHFLTGEQLDATLSIEVFSVTLDVYSAWSTRLVALDASGAVIASDTFEHPSPAVDKSGNARTDDLVFLRRTLHVSTAQPITRFVVLEPRCAIGGPAACFVDNDGLEVAPVVNADNLRLNMPPPESACTYAFTPGQMRLATSSSYGGVVTVSADSFCQWRATPTASWITIVSGNSGTGSGTVSYYVADNTSTSARWGTIVVEGQVYTIAQAGTDGSRPAPFGSFDTPAVGTTGVEGAIAVTGWALDDVQVAGAWICRDALAGETVPVDGRCRQNELFVGGATFVDGARPDVAAMFPGLPGRTRAGWGYMLLTNMLPNRGTGSFTLHAYAQDADGAVALIGSRTFASDNTFATRPFGTIDTPAQGATIAGDAYVNWGWVLTPAPKMMPLDGSTIVVFIDGVPIGPVSYGLYRADIATLFPGLLNTNGAVGFRTIDTTALSNGVHTIAWSATDDSGAVEGLGSRYFTVSNATTVAAATAATMRMVDPGASQYAMAKPRAAAEPAVLVREGYDPAAPLTPVAASPEGRVEVEVPQLGRVEVHLGAPASAGTALPAGSTLDTAAGVFYWTPGPAFTGDYDLSFTRGAGLTGARVRVRVASGGVGLERAPRLGRSQRH